MKDKILKFFRPASKSREFMPPVEPEFPPFGELSSVEPMRAEHAGTRQREPRQVPAVKMPKLARGGGGYEVLTTPADLRSISSRKVLVCGHGLLAALGPLPSRAAEGFARQADRPTMPAGRRLLGGRNAKPLQVAVNSALLQHQGVRYALALDGYLRWGFSKTSGAVALLGGAEAAGTTYIDVYVFRDNVLVDLFERELPAAADRHFSVALKTLQDEIGRKYADARIVAAAPLPDWGSSEIAYLGDEPIRRLSYLPLTAGPASGSQIKRVASIGFAGVVAYGLALGVGWNLYSSAGKAHAVAIDDPVLIRAGGVNNERLGVMQQRRMFMEEVRPQEDLALRSGEIVSGIASIPGVKISKISFGGQTVPVMQSFEVSGEGAGIDQLPDVLMELQVPVEGVSAVRHAEHVMTTVSARTGLKLRLTAGGWTTDEAAGTRLLRIEGFMQ